MENNKDLVLQLEKILISESQVDLSRFRRADELYNSLLAKGVIKRRGYTLRGIEDSNLLNVRFNSEDTTIISYASNLT